MSTNPFEDESGTFHVLVNDHGQHSLWPDFAELPAGWDVRVRSVSRAEALAYVEENWTDLQPTARPAATLR